MTCKPNMEKVKERCNNDYKDKYGKSCTYNLEGKEPTKVYLQCDEENETFFNDACY